MPSAIDLVMTEARQRTADVPRPEDIPRSFYPGMWLRPASLGQPWREPYAEVIRVGRTTVHILSAGCTNPTRMKMEEARAEYRKVYETPTPELPQWIRPGAEFTIYNFGNLRIRQVRWAYASVEILDRGVLCFCLLEGLAVKGEPRRNTWDRLLEDER